MVESTSDPPFFNTTFIPDTSLSIPESYKLFVVCCFPCPSSCHTNPSKSIAILVSVNVFTPPGFNVTADGLSISK